MISAIVLTKDEEKNIKNCLKGLSWCDEIIVIDDYSEDQTVKIAKKRGARVYQRRLDDNFAAQRNYGLGKAKGDWVLFVDADERVSSKLAHEIKKAIKNKKVKGFYLCRKDILWGKQLHHGETAHVRLLRLGQKGAGEWQRRVHETWEIKGEVGRLKEPLLHYPHPTLTEFLKEINYYSSLNARELLKEGQQAGLIQILAYPLAKFLKNYLIRLGFLDGNPGIIVALAMSFHSFLTRAKLYLLWKKGGWWELKQ